MIKSLEKLRGFNPLTGSWEYDNVPIINGIADEIEREIAERYMELPVDMDGVPIKPNDKVTVPNAGSCYYDVFAIAGDYWTDVDGFVHKPEQTVHVKQRTVEDVLAEVENGELSIDDAAAEIRDLLGGDGE